MKIIHTTSNNNKGLLKVAITFSLFSCFLSYCIEMLAFSTVYKHAHLLCVSSIHTLWT